MFTTDACWTKCPIGHTVSMVKSMVLVMDEKAEGQPMMDANSEVTQMVCYMDGIGCLKEDSTVVLGMCVEGVDVLVVNQLWLDLALIQALKLCVFVDVATDRQSWKIVFHNRMHRRQSNYKCMAFVKRLQKPAFVKQKLESVMLLPKPPHERKLATFDERMTILKLH